MITNTPFATASVPFGLPSSRRCQIMGVLNVTPDSFSDGGRYLNVDDAVRHGLSMVRDGADIIDVGGESTRPGAPRVSESAELHRVVPVISALAQVGICVTIDTTRSRVAAAALAVGAIAVNDVSGGLADRLMPGFIAQAQVPYILSHWRGPSAVMAKHARYRDVVTDVKNELQARLRVFDAAGADLRRIIIDPGLGFAKTAEHNWQILNRLPELQGLSRPMLIGASRKSFLRALMDSPPIATQGAASRQLDSATAALSALAAAAGVYCVRVHDVASSLTAVKTAAMWMAGDIARPDGFVAPDATGDGRAMQDSTRMNGPS